MNDNMKLEALWDAETAYWDDYWHNTDFNRTKKDIPDWLEEDEWNG